MVVGPTEIEEDIRIRGAEPLEYNRTTEFSEFILQLEDKLKRVFCTSNDVYFLACSGTGTMECATVNFCSPKDKVVVVSGGTFGDRWCEIATAFNLMVTRVPIPSNDSFDISSLEAALTRDVNAVFVTANETSLGTLCELEAMARVVRQSSAILIVDAISSLGADYLPIDDWGCDVVIASSNKALAIPPGLGFISVSGKAWNSYRNARSPKYYFDLLRYKENLSRGQTPFTPPISLLRQLDLRLTKILADGITETIARHRRLSQHLRARLDELGISTFDKNPANGMVGIKFERVNARDVIMRLRREFKIEITPSPGNDRETIARVGVFGDLSLEDIDRLAAALKEILR